MSARALNVPRGVLLVGHGHPADKARGTSIRVNRFPQYHLWYHPLGFRQWCHANRGFHALVFLNPALTLIHILLVTTLFAQLLYIFTRGFFSFTAVFFHNAD